MSGAESPDGDPHPGNVVTQDDIRGIEKTQQADALPQTLIWVDVDGVWKPVVRMEVTGDDTQRRITKFDPDGEMLESTVMTVPPM